MALVVIHKQSRSFVTEIFFICIICNYNLDINQIPKSILKYLCAYYLPRRIFPKNSISCWGECPKRFPISPYSNVHQCCRL